MQQSSEQKNKTHKLLLLVLGVVLVLASTIVIVWLIFSNKINSDPSPQNLTLEVNDAARQKVLWFNLDIKESKSRPFELSNIQSYSGRKPKPENAALQYRFMISDDDKTLFETSFAVPVIVSESVNRKTGKYTNISTPSTKTVVVRTPWFKDGTKFTVLDKNSSKILEGVIKDVHPGPKK